MFVFAGSDRLRSHMKGVTDAMRTYVAKGEEAEALKGRGEWFVVDATNQVLGRLATKVARVLIGKDSQVLRRTWTLATT